MHKVSIRLVPRIWKSLLLASFVLLASFASTTNYEYGYISHNVEDNSLIIQGNFGQIQISALAGEAIEVFYQQSGVKQLPSYAKAEKKLTLAPSIEINDGEILFSNGKLSASIDKSDLSINFYRENELLTRQKSYFLSSNKRGFDFTLDKSEKIAGGGERVLGMDRRGHRLPLYNRAHYGYETNSKQMNFSLPAIMSSKKYTILFDNTAKGFLDIGKTEANTLTFEAVAGRTSYMVFAADNYPGLIHNYVDVTGKQPLPPRWAFGHFISRFGYRSEWEVRDVVNRTLEAGIPADAVI
ncbi:MAG: glycosyl hydrolase, partial [Gammaproteobacteria bacterium]|nr:glycosyl hydrolase [Gammaproteobacteria bacterium]